MGERSTPGRMGSGLGPVLLALLVMSGRAVSQSASEYELKAAFLYKFASFAVWPTTVAAPLCIGVLGEDPFGGVLERVVHGRSLNGRAFAIRRFKVLKDIASCEIVFISPSETGRLEQIFSALEGSPVLTVGDVPGFCEKGGIVNLATREQRVSLQVNLEAAERAHLQLSSKLLSLAAIVRGRRE